MASPSDTPKVFVTDDPHPNYDGGITASIKSGNTNADGSPTEAGIGPVWYDSNLVGAGPDPKTANGTLKDLRRAGSDGIDLWINDFSADFSITGVTAQSHLKRDFFPRYFTQPEYAVSGQCATQYDYNRLARYIRVSQINQLVGAPPSAGLDLLQLILKGDDTAPGRSTKGGNKPWNLLGYIKSAPAGAQRFVVAPTFTFTFVLADARGEGIMAELDSMLTTGASDYFGGATNFLSAFVASIPDPNIPAPKPWGADTPKATKPPTSQPAGPIDSGTGDANRPNNNPITASFQDFNPSILGND